MQPVATLRAMAATLLGERSLPFTRGGRWEGADIGKELWTGVSAEQQMVR
jgi:hypothetical protein